MTDADKIIADIARKQLRIETLETRESDSLDFHDVSVWGLRTALLCAFEAGRQTVRTKSKSNKNSKEGSSYRATIEASYQDLVEVWGEPGKGDEYKTEAEWVIRPPAQNDGWTRQADPSRRIIASALIQKQSIET
jgi:hypothetical protein